MNDEQARALRAIPSVTAILADDQVRRAAACLDPDIVTGVVRRAQEAVREAVLAGDLEALGGLVPMILGELEMLDGRRSSVVINGTGVIIQTNLGRAPVSRQTAEAMRAAATNYLALETDLETGERGGRGAEVEVLMRALTGAERTLVVNNNAAAVMLMLAATSAGRAVIVSRGEAVEIGGGFRVPDVLRQSGAHLVEVGTTNRTYVRDYATAIDDATAALLRVHASNFTIVGFSARPELSDLVTLARDRGVLTLEDVGSGCLLDTAAYGLEHEPTLGESIAAGVDVVCASGDKLLGGPQAGLILGRAEVVDEIRRHPLARALRADKTALAGIAATLRHYVRRDAEEHIPVWWSISRPLEWLHERAKRWSAELGSGAAVERAEAVIGGGSLPGKTLPSAALALDPGARGPDALARSLRTGRIHVVPRILDGKVAIDARTVLEGQDEQLLEAIRESRS